MSVTGNRCNFFKHGMKRLPEYRVWQAMKRRCDWPKHTNYKYYGGRGIGVCERWANDFMAFYADMGPRPTGMTLDRIDRGGNYSPSNCRWATLKQQARNKSNNRMLSYGGRVLTIAEWSEKTGIPPGTLAKRLDSGWSEYLALTTIPYSGNRVAV